MLGREKLIELLMDKPFGNSTEEREIAHAEDVAEYLIDCGVTVRERGRWLLDGRCSECLENPLTTHKKFCPNCGADMRGEEDGT